MKVTPRSWLLSAAVLACLAGTAVYFWDASRSLESPQPPPGASRGKDAAIAQPPGDGTAPRGTATAADGVAAGSLLDAIARNDVEFVRKLLASGISPNAMDADGSTALARAIEAQNTEIVDLLLQANASLETPPGAEPLLVAALRVGDEDLVQQLLQRGAPVNPPPGSGDSPLVAAISSADESMVQTFVAAGANVNAADGAGVTPLQAAIDSGNVKIVATLLQRGADVNAAGGEGETPLQQATNAGETRIVELLEQAGAAE